MSNLSANQARAALDALFETRPHIATEPDDELEPLAEADGTELDADEASGWGLEVTRPRPAFQAEPAIDIDLPTGMDAAIQADAALAWDFESYRWYRGVDAQGVTRVFRFQRGKPLTDWHAQLRTQRLQSVAGPFRTQQQATAKPA